MIKTILYKQFLYQYINFLLVYNFFNSFIFFQIFSFFFLFSNKIIKKHDLLNIFY